ncbi:MAG: hypothetical protein CBD74_10130 [Saprospirales bacterium TMED214]|nr:MAG: hypothetical protein CBD74_10130 [Saprospirales bacterium TMED214]
MNRCPLCRKEKEPMPFRIYCLLFATLIVQANIVSIAADSQSVVHFDIPPNVAAEVIESGTGRTLLQVELKLSSMISSPEAARIDQWLVRCQPRGQFASIVDYSPRTELGSDIATPIQVRQSKEKHQSLGVGVNGDYFSSLRGNAGLDHTRKNIDALQFDRLAPLHAVTAAGTINRGTGVYFKLRWTAEQILEGQKTFHLGLDVPDTWRTGLIDISVVAQSEQKSFASWEQSTKTLGAANFVIAVYRSDDIHACEVARRMANAEHQLRSRIKEEIASEPNHSLSTLLRKMTKKMEFEKPSSDLMERLMLNKTDPRLDSDIRKLPMPCRLAALNYSDAQDSFTRLNDQPINK